MLAAKDESGAAARPVSKPRRPLPAGAWDCHAHVFGPFDRFPLHQDAKYRPPFAPKEAHRAMLDTIGLARGVLVHASGAGFDNSGTADAVAASNGRIRGIGVVPRDCPDALLAEMGAQGFCGIRFTENGFGPRGAAQPGVQTLDDLPRFAPRLKELGWHAQVWAKCDFIVETADMIAGLGIPVVFDHMGFFDIARGTDDRVFRGFVDLLGRGDFYVKMTVGRVSHAPPGHDDARPFHDIIVAAHPDKVLFGTDWPYIGHDADPPDAGKMVDLFDLWTPDETIRRKIFVDNPHRIYGR